jgi:fumarate hydratase subunit beta
MEGQKIIRLTTPLCRGDVEMLRCGDRVSLSGIIYTARDAAHKRIVEAIKKGEVPPIEFDGQVIYFAGPSPARPGRPTGSIGPTTSYRMDAYSPVLIEKGLRGMIGKGGRGAPVKEAMQRYGCVYFGATGGAGASIAKAVRKMEVIAYEDLGPEAVRRLLVQDFPLVVINDTYGGDLYEEGQRAYRKDDVRV